MRALILLLIALPVAALDNAVRVTEATGAAKPSRPLTVFRFFAEHEFPAHAQPRVDGAAAAYWQNDVKTRWPDGSLQQTYVSLWLPSMTAGQQVMVDFVPSDDACHLGGPLTCQAAALTRSEMLGFDTGSGAGSWGAKLTATQNGTTHSASARTMLAAWNGRPADLTTRYWLRGPVATEVIVEDATPALQHDFGWQWDTGTSQWIAAPSATHKSLHPIFVLRFYPATGNQPAWRGVRADVILQNLWNTKLQKQVYTPAILAGGSEDAATPCAAEARLPCSTTEPVTHTARSSRHWLVWSGTEPGAIITDLNLPYLIHAKLIPQYEYWRTPGAEGTGLETAEYDLRMGTDTDAQKCSNVAYCGQFVKGLEGTGGRGELALFPRWYVRWLGVMGNGAVGNAMRLEGYRKWVLGNADAGATAPFQMRESDTVNRTYGGTGQRDQFFSRYDSTPAFGRMVSVNARPTAYANSSKENDASTHVKDRTAMLCSGTTTCSADKSQLVSALNRWSLDLSPSVSHLPSFHILPAIVTGDWYYLDLVQMMGGHVVSSNWQAASYTSAAGHALELGIIQWPYNNWRAHPWMLRELHWAAALAPDGMPEKAYLKEKLINNARLTEGALSISDGNYPPASYTDVHDASCTGWASPSWVTAYYTSDAQLGSAYSVNLWCLGRQNYNEGKSSPLNIATSYQRSTNMIGMDPTITSQTSAWFWQTYALIVWSSIADTDLVRDGSLNPYYHVARWLSGGYANRTLRSEAKPMQMQQIVAARDRRGDWIAVCIMVPIRGGYQDYLPIGLRHQLIDHHR